MRINKVTGERFQEGSIGSKVILTSMSTGLVRVVDNSSELEKVLKKVKSKLPVRVKSRVEKEYISDLVRSIQLEVNYLRRESESVHLKF